jgi:hypothetical protein
MGARSPRSVVEIPSTVQAGTDNDLDDPRILRFKDKDARPCLVTNLTGGGRHIRVKVNTDTDFDPEAGFFTIPDQRTLDVSVGGLIAVNRVSFVTLNAADDLDDVKVYGWVA